MDDRLSRTIASLANFEDLETFVGNARARGALTDEVDQALKLQATVLSRAIVADRTGIDLATLMPAEAKIVEAVAEYVGIKRRQGTNANRTLKQIKDHGLIEAAERSVMRSKPTMGFTTLADSGRDEMSFEQIIVDYPDAFSTRALWYARRTLGLPNENAHPPGQGHQDGDSEIDTPPSTVRRNPPWSRDELILALDLYLKLRHESFTHDSPEIGGLSLFLVELNRSPDEQDTTFRNENGVYMKLMNFRRFDPEFTSEGKIGLTRGNKQEGKVWFDFANDPAGLAGAVTEIRNRVVTGTLGVRTPYWVFVCNPKKWAVDRFLDRRIEHDSWGVRPSDRDRFAPGQLGIVRVGVDRRSVAERNGATPLQPGIYAICEVESEAYDGTGAADEFWATGEIREPGWPTVKLRYLRTFMDAPLTIERMRAEAPDISPLVLSGFQASSFPISADDFHRILAMLGHEAAVLSAAVEADDLPGDKLAELERRYLNAAPEVKERIGRSIERGKIGSLVKKRNGFRCQVCGALGHNPIGFIKPDGEPYIEAHHVMPVSSKQVGSLSASNVMTVCANHHRQLHFGGINVVIAESAFEFVIEGTTVSISRLSIAAS